MNNNITHLTNGDFDVMPDNESLNFVLGEIRKDAVEQYKAGLLEWLKSEQKKWETNYYVTNNAFEWGAWKAIELIIKHIEGEK